MTQKLDPAQIDVLNQLRALAHNLENQSSKSRWFKKLKKIFHLQSKNSHHHYGFYIYGDVGRGKTMLMKKFYSHLTQTPKIYFHFHNFMNRVHQSLHEIRQNSHHNSHEIELALQKIIGDKTVICFDEFQVNDVADAMLLSRIFSFFFRQHKIVIITSNHHPLNLYQNGLQRESFLNFVNKTLLKKIKILNLDSPYDYRRHDNHFLDRRFIIENQENQAYIDELIKKLTHHDHPQTQKIKVWGREILIKNSYNKEKIAIFEFNELFRNIYSSLDFYKICEQYNLLIIKFIPKLERELIDEIKRFTIFIDELYESKTALIVTSHTDIEQFNSVIKYAPYFSRTISRLNEIFSENFWQNSKFFKKNL